MQKVVVYIASNLPDKSPGALRVMSNAKAIRDAGFKVIFINFSNDPSIGHTTFEGFECYQLQLPENKKEWIKDLTGITRLIPILKKINQYTAIIIYGPTAFQTLKLRQFAHSHNAKLIVDCAEWHTATHLHGIKKAIKKFDVFFNMRYAQKLADGLIVISTYLAKYYSKQSTLIVPPLVDKSENKWKQISSHTNDGIRKFVYAGSMGPDKDLVNEIIRCFISLGDFNFKFDIIGVSQSDFSNSFPEIFAKCLELDDKICFHGFIPHKEVLNYIKKADFSILLRSPTRKNNAGFPTKLGESITCETPVICNEFSDVAEIVMKNNIGFIIENREQLSDILIRAINISNKELQVLRRNCKECNFFDYRQYTSRILTFINT